MSGVQLQPDHRNLEANFVMITNHNISQFAHRSLRREVQAEEDKAGSDPS